VAGRIVATDMEALTGLGGTGLDETGLGETGCFADVLASHIRTSLNGNIPGRMFSNCFTIKWGDLRQSLLWQLCVPCPLRPRQRI